MRTDTCLARLSALAILVMAGCAHGDEASSAPFDPDAGAPSAASNSEGDAGTSAAPPPVPDAGSPTSDDAGDPGTTHDLDAAAETSTQGGAGNDAAVDAADASAVASLIGRWSFEEGTGTSSADLSGHGHPATLVGGASWSAAGKVGGALALDGTTGYADVGPGLVDTAHSFSVLSWVKLAVVNSWEVALSQDDVTGSLFGLKLRGDGTNAFDFDVETSDVTNPGFVVAQSTTTAPAQSWVHLAGVYDASGAGALKIYVNGALEANAAVGLSVGASGGHFVLGRGLYNGATGSFLNGALDEVEVHSEALSSAAVAAIYAAQK